MGVGRFILNISKERNDIEILVDSSISVKSFFESFVFVEIKRNIIKNQIRS